MKKVVVIGSNSFSGSYFINFLLEKTKYNVIGISRSLEKKEFYLNYKKQDLSRFEFYHLDLNNDLQEFLKLLDEQEPEYVVNFASQSMVAESWEHPEHWYKTNVLSIVALTNSLKERKYLKKFVQISTPEVYGNCTGCIKEDAPMNPSTPYAASRAASDVFIQLLVKTYNFPAVFTRAANVYGAGQQLFKIIPRSIVYIKKGKKIPMHGGGEAKRSFIHIKDVCDATSRIMERAAPGEVYHISRKGLYSIKNLVAMICEKMGTSFEAAAEAAGTRLGLDAAYILDSTKAETEFGWKPKITLEEGINEVIQWIEDNWDSIINEPLEYQHQE